MTDSQFGTLVTAAGVLVLGLFQAWLSSRHKASTDRIGEKVDTAAIKREEATATVAQILVDVNSKSVIQNDRADGLLKENQDLKSKIAVYEERLRPDPQAMPVQSIVADSHVDKVIEAIKQ